MPLLRSALRLAAIAVIATLPASPQDRSTATSRNPVHTFTTPGPKVVELTVCNARGCSTTRKTVIVLDPRPAVSSIAVPAVVGSAEAGVLFSAQVTGKPVVSVSWALSGPWGAERLAGNPVPWVPGALGLHQVQATASNASGQVSAPASSLLVVPSTFTDVPAGSAFFDAIETLVAAGYTAGCGSRRYCPGDPVSRAEAAVFLSRGLSAQTPPPPAPAVSLFADVPAGFWASRAIHHLYLLGITRGCYTNPLRYCPADPLSRAEAAVLLVLARHGAQFHPPAATGRFSDVPPGFWAAPFIEQLARDGVTAGCAPARFCPEDPVSRAAMAAFLVGTFGLVQEPRPTRFALGTGAGSYPAGIPLSVELAWVGGLPSSYEYDWNGDGVFEEVSPVPVSFHVFPAAGLVRPAVRLRRGGSLRSLSVASPITLTAPNFFLTPSAPGNVSARFLRQVDPGPASPPGTLPQTAFAVGGSAGSAPNVLGYLAYLSLDGSSYRFLALLPADLASAELLTPRLGAGRTASLQLRAFNAYGAGSGSLPVRLEAPAAP